MDVIDQPRPLAIFKSPTEQPKVVRGLAGACRGAGVVVGHEPLRVHEKL
ncbi:hypothetical protein HanXRQr2_Chr05g0206831 [Helianthus annuus]|uniref:Uncharacterized protein n=1 Tax=Helianthus annuus TaxID=4232 RepID=A0A9K3NM11_HELAN|nr:hypothetical protein HanXRQr2_Chr05g0206831 [Helianthus annuus]